MTEKGTCQTCGQEDVTLCEVLGRDACVLCGIACGWLLGLRARLADARRNTNDVDVLNG